VRRSWVLIPWVAGCWTTELPGLPAADLVFEPASGDGPADWAVTAWPMGDLTCPEGETPRFWVVHPEVPTTDTMPAVVVFHPRAFDYHPDPDPADPLGGPTWRAPSQLGADASTRAVFELLGMGTGDGTGALVSALAGSGRLVFLPSNCWGDLYANDLQDRPGNAVMEGFDRRGYDAAAFGWEMISNEAFPTLNRVDLPVLPALDDTTLIGLGDGGRAVLELLADEEAPTAALMDSTPDDLGVYWRQTDGLYDAHVEGLLRVFPDRAAAEGDAVASIGFLPERFGYLYSRVDPVTPVDAHTAAVAALAREPDAWVWDHGRPTHAALADDPELAAAAVAWLGGSNE
jgi:hypothetical protein